MNLIIAFFYVVLVLLFFGIIIAFSPTLVITELAILTKSKKPLIHTIAFIAGIFLPIFLLSLLAVMLIDPSYRLSIPNLDEAIGTTPLIDIFAGTLFLIGAIRLLNSSPKQQSRFKPEKLLNTKTLFWFGAIKMATSASSLQAILYAARFLKTNTTESLQQVVGLFWLLVVSFLPFVIIASSKKLSPKVLTESNNLVINYQS